MGALRWCLTLALLAYSALPARAEIPADWVIQGRAPEWVFDFDGPASDLEHADDVTVSPDGSLIFVTGGSVRRENDWDWITMALDRDGTIVWQAVLDSAPGHDGEIARAIATDGDRVFVTGEGMTRSRDERGVTIAYDAQTGRRLWQRRFAKANPKFDDDYVYSTGLVLGPDGRRVYVAGTRFLWRRGTTEYDTRYAIWAYRADDGRKLWSSSVDRGEYSQVVNAVAIDPRGRYIVTTGEGGDGFGTLAVRASDGTVVWFSRYDPRGFQNGVAIAASRDAVFAAGYDRNIGATVAYDLVSGRRRWVSRYDVDPSTRGAQPDAIAVSSDGRSVAVTGFREGEPTGDDEMATVRYSAGTGRERWAVSDPGPGGFAGGADVIFPTTGDRVIATGFMSPYGIVAIGYELDTGARIWRGGAHDGEGELEGGDAITASPDGLRVYIVATTSGGSDGQDFATLAYRS